MIAYPANLPQPSNRLTGDSSTPVVRTDLDTGLVIQQGRFATGHDTYQLSWKLSQAEVVIFEEWFNETLVGGQLLFALTMAVDGGLEEVPARFVGGDYTISHDGAFWFVVGATAEVMFVSSSAPNRTPPVPQWKRLALDETLSQTLGLSFRNAVLTTRPDLGSVTTLRVPPPINDTAFIYFGVKQLGDGEVLITSEDVPPLPVWSTPAFPAGLPAIDMSFGEVANRVAERLDMESGHVRQWLRFDTTTKKYSAKWEFDLDQLQDFRDFFFTTLQSGSRSFTIKLPVDGQFENVVVRFVGGKFSESYVPHNRFAVQARLERVVAQTVTPTTERPFPLYYAPAVSVYVNRKVTAGDAFKMFNVFPAAGETVNLHIHTLNIEFGVTVKGLGNVLITRGPFIYDIGTFGETGLSAFYKLTLSLRDTIVDIGTIPPDVGASEFLPTTMSLISVILDIGTTQLDEGASEFLLSRLELLEVEVDGGSFADSGASVYMKSTIELIEP